MYAQLCKRLSEEAPNFDSPSKTCTFVRLLLNVCEDKFINRSSGIQISYDGQLTPEEEEKRHVAKQRMLGNVKFIGELHKLSMLSTDVLHRCIQELLDKRNSNATIQDRCEDMECLCQLIRTCGKNLDTEKGKRLMDQYFENMDQRSKSQKYPPRIRFMLRDIIELRDNNWIPRKVATTEGPVPIRQIRTDDDNLIRPSYINRNRDMRNNERDNDSWMNRFSLNLQPGFNDMFSGLSVSSPPHITSPNYNNNRHYNQRNNQNMNNNFNNRFNKHNNQHNNSHNASSYTNMMMMNNKDLAPRFKRNLITANQDPVENLQMRPAANSLLFKANVNIKAPTMLPISTPPPLSSGGALSSSSMNSSSSSSTPPTSVSPVPQHQQQQYIKSTPMMSSGMSQSAVTSDHYQSSSQTSSLSNTNSQNSIKMTNASSNLQSSNNKTTNNSGGGGGGAHLNVGNEKETTIITKSGSVEKSGTAGGKQGKKDKGPSKEETLKRVLTFLNENLIINDEESHEKNIDDIVVAFNELKVPDKFWKDAFALILNEIIDKSELQYQRCIEFLQQLRKDNKQSNALLESFKIVINKMNEKESTIPCITTSVATLLAKAVQAKLCKLTDISQYTENGQHYPLFLLVLQQLHKILGKDKLYELFNESKINLMTSLPDAERSKDRMAYILEKRNLNFLYPLLKLQAEMMEQIQTEPNPNQFYGWIKRNVDSKHYTEPGFIQALMTVVLKYITKKTSLTEGIEKNPKSIDEKEQDLVLKYCNILELFLRGRSDLQLIALYSLQVYCYNLGFPKGMLRWWFKFLWEANVIEDDVFLKWKEEINDEYPGKGEALFHVNTWLTWLEQAESDDED